MTVETQPVEMMEPVEAVESVASVEPTVLIAPARVRRTERLSPAYVRVFLESPAFEDLGEDGFDTRFKMVFPGAQGHLPDITAGPGEWYEQWLAMPDATRSPMRTYTVRDVVEEDGARLLVVDLVVHEHGPQGPACRWALSAAPGHEIHVIAPHRASSEYGGTEFDPGACEDLLLIADETAVPALARILADMRPGLRGRAFVEVPSAQDVLPLELVGDVEVTWLVRGGAEHGRRLVETVRRHLGLAPLDPALLPDELPSDLDVEVWETPRHSSSGEDLGEPAASSALPADLTDLYAWIAGESWLVKALRRSLVTELGADRGRVAFMGYWRQGVSMRS